MLPGSALLQDGDTFWHIRTGQWILDHAQFPVVDFYSYTAAGRRWISGEWLSEILFALAYNGGSWRGVVLLTATVIAAIIGILCFYLLQKLRFSVAIGWTAVTAVAISTHFLARPHIFSYLLLLVWLIILVENYDRGIFRPSVVTLAAIMVLWANMHGSFTFGLVLLYIFAAFACYQELSQRHSLHCKRAFLILASITGCALLTPYGVYAPLLTLEVLNLKFVLHHVSEWAPPNFQNSRIHLILLVGFLAAIAGLGIQLQGPRVISFSAILFLCLSYTRGVAMFFLLLPIIFAKPLLEKTAWCRSQLTGARVNKDAKDFDPILLYVYTRPIYLLVIFSAVAAFVTAFSWHHIDVGPPKSIAPKAAIDFVARAGITGNVFNSYSFGGYLIFSGIPTFIDSRVPPYTDEFMRNAYETAKFTDPDKAFDLLRQYNVSWVILQPTEPLAKALARSRAWEKIYSDKYSIVLIRR